MAFKIFLDANILIDILLQRENYLISKKLLGYVIQGNYKAFTTPAIIHITSYWVSKFYDKKTIKLLLLNLLSDIRVIDCSHDITISALKSNMTDIEDALQYYTALHHKINFFITQDKNLIKSAIPSLPTYTPKEFLEIHN